LAIGEPLQGSIQVALQTQGCRWRSNAGLKLANAFGVFQTEPVGVFQTQPPPGGDLPTILTKSFVSDESPGTFKI
jgi:hypothetical protein